MLSCEGFAAAEFRNDGSVILTLSTQVCSTAAQLYSGW